MTDTLKYGPQTPEVEALLKRARTLTIADMRALGAVWDAALDEVRGSVRDAMLALISRHLIAPKGFTQAHYDLLTGPWRKTVGKVHPDDAPLTESTGGI